jgi:tripartite-type tricarboxylate transporter receptor subunit TctC
VGTRTALGNFAGALKTNCGSSFIIGRATMYKNIGRAHRLRRPNGGSMKVKGFLSALTFGVVAAMTAPGCALAQDKSSYPNRTVRLVVPFPAGQATDIIARLLAERLSQRWGQAVYVDNKGGGASIPGMMAGREAPADGYTITFASSTTTAVNEALYPKLPYNMQRDFVPVAPVFTQPWLIVANPAAPYNNLKDLVDAAKKEPGKLTWGFGANALELAAELFKQRAGIDIVGVPYKGSGPAMNDLVGGHIMLGVDTMASMLPHIKAGRLKPLATLSDKRSPLLPDVPTVAEQGYPGFISVGWAGLFAPKGTPPDIVQKISSDVQQILSEPAVQQAVADRGSTPDLRTLPEWSVFVSAETVKWAEVIKKGNIKLPE